MEDLNTFELINITGGDSNCLCRNSNYEFFKTNETDGPSCAVSCCQPVADSYDMKKYYWIWSGKEYSTEGSCSIETIP